jgi:hypothetical protein
LLITFAEIRNEDVWTGDLGYPDDPESVIKIEKLRVFEGSILVFATSVYYLGHWRFETRLFETENGEEFQYTGQDITQVGGKGQEVKGTLFTLAMSLHKTDDELQVTGEWREGGIAYPFEGTLLQE